MRDSVDQSRLQMSTLQVVQVLKVAFNTDFI